MIDFTERHSAATPSVALAAALAALCITSSLAQTAPDAVQDRSAESSAFSEEIEVRGRRPLGLLRVEAQAARERVWEVFNEITPNEEFHIHCSSTRSTGSRIPQRTCRPNFARAGASDSARALLDGLFQNCESMAVLPPGESALFHQCAQVALSAAQIGLTEIRHKERLLDEEIRRLALEDPNLQQAIIDYHSIYEEYNEARRGR